MKKMVPFDRFCLAFGGGFGVSRARLKGVFPKKASNDGNNEDKRPNTSSWWFQPS